MHIEYLKDSNIVVTNIFGDLVEFEHMLKRTSAASTNASVSPLTPGLSGAAVLLVRFAGPSGSPLSWIVKIAKDSKLILAELENYEALVRGRLASAPKLIGYSPRLLIYEYGGILSRHHPQTLRSGYSASSAAALAVLMDRLVTELHPLHDLAYDTVSAIERMTFTTPLQDRLQNIDPRLPNEVAVALVETWEGACNASSRFHSRRSGAHGDLNTGNVLFEPGDAASYPVIIDFASMRKGDDSNHHLFWDYAKVERDIKTRMFIKEALASGMGEADLISAVTALDADAALPASSLPAVQKLFSTVRALKSAVQKKYSPELYEPGYRLSVAFATLLVLFRPQPDSDVDLRIQYRVAATSVITLLAEFRRHPVQKPILLAQATAPAPPSPPIAEDGLMGFTAEYVRSIDEGNCRSLRVYQQRVRRQLSGSKSLPTMLDLCKKIRTHISARRSNPPMSEGEYSELRDGLTIAAAIFSETSSSVLEWLAAHGAYIHDSASWGADMAATIPASLSEFLSRQRTNDYDWENIERLLRTLNALGDFDTERASLGYVVEEQVPHRDWVVPLFAASCFAEDGRAPAIAVIDAASSGADGMRFVARRKPLSSPQIIASGEHDWLLFAHDEDYIYEWSPKLNTPGRQFGVRDKRIYAFCISGHADKLTVYALTDGNRLLRLGPDGASKTHDQILRGFSLLPLNGSAWPAVFQASTHTAMFQLPQPDGSLRSLCVSAMPREGDFGSHIRILSQKTEGPDSFLSLSVPSDLPFDLRRVQSAGSGYVALKFQSTIKRQTYHHLCLIDLNDLSAAPWILSTSYRLFDIRFVRLEHRNVIVVTHLIDSTTTHCVSVWRLSIKSELVQESLMDPAERGDATDLHVMSVGQNTFDASYCFRRRDQVADEIRRFTWPTMEKSVLLGKTAPSSREGDSASFPEFGAPGTS